MSDQDHRQGHRIARRTAIKRAVASGVGLVVAGTLPDPSSQVEAAPTAVM